MPANRPHLPRIRGTQIGFRDPSQIDTIKADMLAGRFAYHEVRAQVGGWLDRHGVYHVYDGHHRMAAALEIYRETGDAMPARLLLILGDWKYIDRPPRISRPMPARDWWGALRNWLKYLS
jgi:filamentous hemagglutinin